MVMFLRDLTVVNPEDGFTLAVTFIDNASQSVLKIIRTVSACL